MSTEPKKENNGMDPLMLSTLITLTTQIAGIAIKYNDPAIQAPAVEAVLAHLETFKALQPLPEEYDAGFVDGIMEQIKNFIGERN